VKFGGEVRTETFSARFRNAVGYVIEPIYFVPSGIIAGAHDLKCARPFVSKGASFAAHDSNYATTASWHTPMTSSGAGSGIRSSVRTKSTGSKS